MQLGLSLLIIHINKIPYRGKYRRVKKPSMHDLLKMKKDFERQEQNMLILRHPYLTVELNHGHMKDMYLKSRNKTFFRRYEQKIVRSSRKKLLSPIVYAT
ncbi:PREDICTED: uncharacterized protein LOC105146445 [Acromyrmex echinatior]|uniref:uncharacterized protein LOC105146445 n=1 Tax=Acromyrmex echinatior TaxID=103372 RepID=UPI0005810907|nr:PREDICTED: uncharacterized protein LOC105146445 [Acromyrmex echinatior]